MPVTSRALTVLERLAVLNPADLFFDQIMFKLSCKLFLRTYYWLDPLSNSKIDAVIDKGLAIPLISGFRVLLEERDGVLVWLTAPIKFFDKYVMKLVRTIMNVSENVNNDPHTVGRDPQVDGQLTSEVGRWYLEGQIKKQLQAGV